MKRTLILLVGFILFSNEIIADNWLTSFEEAKKLAIASDKLILVDFWATWCGPCKRMDSETWSKDDIKLLMNSFVPLKVDIDLQRTLAMKYSVRSIPYIFIMDANGKVVFQEKSYKRKGEIIALLKKYAVNTSYIKQDLLNYYKNPDFTSSFRLASKYNDLSVHLNDDLRRDFFRLSNEYFKISKNKIADTDLKNKDDYLLKIELYEIQELLVYSKTEKALKNLNKINENEIHRINESFYNFLNYVAHLQFKDETALKWEGKVSSKDREKALLFLKHA